LRYFGNYSIWANHIAQNEIPAKTEVRKTEGKRPFGKLGVDGRIILKRILVRELGHGDMV
jgi:hypothetical protein